LSHTTDFFLVKPTFNSGVRYALARRSLGFFGLESEKTTIINNFENAHAVIFELAPSVLSETSASCDSWLFYFCKFVFHYISDQTK
jgi:hypothetical protein